VEQRIQQGEQGNQDNREPGRGGRVLEWKPVVEKGRTR
jgi:hypothetical protein